ncbi:MAG: hypothetical protein ACN6OP_21275 [Pseudomonadales bacterium]|uniref:hypothetical protein n=1 Tax=Cupriavidus sp. TaxID=1873897 RepID=UPI003D1164D3
MKNVALRAGIFSAALLVLGGCGGGGDGGSAAPGGGTAPQPTQTVSLTGKAIDGYLANAKVCFDDGQGGCDSSLPMTTTDGTGSYILNASVNVIGKQINVIVTPETTDLSNPGVPFSSTFTLSAVVSGNIQNITPLTTMVVSQVKAGRTAEQALQAVQNLTGSASIDPAADFIASSDKGTAAIAASMISRLTALGGQGPISWSQVQATMNAYAAKGNIAGVQQTDVNAQLASSALSAEADATAVLASPLYTVDGDLMQSIIGATPDGTLSPVREKFSLAGSTLSVVQEVQSNGAWSPAAPVGSYDGWFSGTWISQNGGAGAYEMKADGSWTDWLSAARMHPSYPLSSVGSKLVGTDPNTGDKVTVSYRTIDVGGSPLSSSLHIDYRNPVRGSMVGTFAPGTTSYLATMTYGNDRLMLTKQGIGLPWINGQSALDSSNVVDGVPLYTLGDPAQVYTSVQQAVGTQTDIGGGCVLLNLKANAVAEVDKSNKVGCNYTNNPLNFPVVGSWSIYPRNQQVMTINLPKAVGAANVPINDRVKNAVLSGGSLVVGLMNGKLMTGYLQPDSQPTTVMQFRADVTDVAAASMRAAAIRIGQRQNP